MKFHYPTPEELAEMCRALKARGDAAKAKQDRHGGRPPAPTDLEGWTRHCQERLGVAHEKPDTVAVGLGGDFPAIVGGGPSDHTNRPPGAILGLPAPNAGHAEYAEFEDFSVYNTEECPE